VVILGESPFTTGVPKFFLMQAVGILIESTELNFWVAISKVATNEAPAGRTTKLMGYVWVLAWITWTGPSFTWLVARALVQGKDDVVFWSFIKWLDMQSNMLVGCMLLTIKNSAFNPGRFSFRS
jgi:hypothetical protein